jgi:hypothetical protein
MLHLHRFKKCQFYDYEENNASSGHDIRQKPKYQAYSVSLARRQQESIPFSAHMRVGRGFAIGRWNGTCQQYDIGST